jgi:hypothetical protein
MLVGPSLVFAPERVKFCEWGRLGGFGLTVADSLKEYERVSAKIQYKMLGITMTKNVAVMAKLDEDGFDFDVQNTKLNAPKARRHA